ncbi:MULTISPECIES: UDP-N-acetylmuramoyl-L-alanyl-D-glutamate--2,6-diaminopimelate ligase [Bhargavaea]|uniref:UDP-N-acetylmuramoyl-L-alanyl-D-glutamate--2,6-diaminopimelate ligase n=1 Tax=Bhargavaea changchunensis TaxID=2134037 RepID=A0ABW2NDK5_9BACL|nr:UDP-N-acetylmuramoyl-L-alanyl-D-glutamate--2,6-diaminopimelate ligase [Bhargavaea sp. CC-171006]
MIELCELLKNWPCTAKGGDFRALVSGVTDHSAEVTPGSVFVARKGRSSSGLDHIQEALRNGAVAVVTDISRPPALPKGVSAVSVPDAADFLAYSCSAFYGHPSRELTVFAVTGTNGKTTTTRFIGQLLKSCGIRAAVIGTLGVWIAGRKAPLQIPPMTTLPPAHLHRVLRYCADEGVTHVAMEASSLGLSGRRLDHCSIDYGIFLNIGTDHHAEHGGEEAYLRAKGRLSDLAGQIIVNSEDPAVLSITGDRLPVKTFGEQSGGETHLRIVDNGKGDWIITAGETHAGIRAPVEGRHNRLNAAAAFASLMAAGFGLADLCKYAARLSLPEGRMQEAGGAGIRVFVDYAHTPDALEAVLSALSSVCTGRLISVFGCGGDRDREKRPQMGRVAGEYSDSVWVTSDNPRSEEPARIISDVMEGLKNSSAMVRAEPDREQAIRGAIYEADPGDIVLIAGKGHEEIQISKSSSRPFSDFRTALRFLDEREAEAGAADGDDRVQTTDRFWYDGSGME